MKVRAGLMLVLATPLILLNLGLLVLAWFLLWSGLVITGRALPSSWPFFLLVAMPTAVYLAGLVFVAADAIEHGLRDLRTPKRLLTFRTCDEPDWCRPRDRRVALAAGYQWLHLLNCRPRRSSHKERGEWQSETGKWRHEPNWPDVAGPPRPARPLARHPLLRVGRLGGRSPLLSRRNSRVGACRRGPLSPDPNEVPIGLATGRWTCPGSPGVGETLRQLGDAE